MDIYLLKVNSKNTTTNYKTCSKLTIKASESLLIMTRFYTWCGSIDKEVNIHWDSFYITVQVTVMKIEKLLKNNCLYV